jgi:sugar-phosphatase
MHTSARSERAVPTLDQPARPCPRGIETVVQPSAVLFDLDGVMVHSNGSIERAWRGWAGARGLPWETVEPYVSGYLTVDTVRAVLPGLSPEAAEREAIEVNRRQVVDTARIRPVAGMRRLVEVLPRSCWAVVTSCPRELAVARLAAAGYPLPSTLVTAEDVVRGKPDPEGYLLAAARLGVVATTCLVLEDSPAGVAAGRAAGMAVVGITTTHPPATLGDASMVVPDGTWLQGSREPESQALLVRIERPRPAAGGGRSQPLSGQSSQR